MEFTDDDLEMLKDMLKAKAPESVFSGMTIGFMKELIGRLEAAEACIPHVYANGERFRALKKWRKIAGKS